MIRLIRLYTGQDGQSHIKESQVTLKAIGGNNQASIWTPVSKMRFEESSPGSSLDWHTAPHRQYVITLTGTLEFTTRKGETFELKPGDILLAEDTTGGGHRWRLIDDQPWRRIYVQSDDSLQPP